MTNGLAQQFDVNSAINDLRYNAQMKKQANALAEQQAKLFADDFAYNNAMNSFDNPRVKALAQLQTKRIGRFVNENPDWRTNVEKRAMYSNMIHDLKDNPDLNRGLISDKNIQDFQKDLAEKIKRPDLYDAEAYDNIKKQVDNYNRFGNQFANSKEDVEKLGGIKPFSYEAPRDFVDLTKEGLDYGNKFNDFKVETDKKGLPGNYKEVPKEESLNASTFDFYKRNERQLNKEANRVGVDPIQYAKQLIKAGIKGKYDHGDIGVAFSMQKYREEKNGAKVPIEGVWSKDVVRTDKSVVNGDVLKDAFGSKPPLVIQSDDGKQGLDLTGNEVNYTGFSTYLGDDKKRGIKHFAVTTKITKAEAEKRGLIQDASGLGTGDEITPEWRKKAKLVNETNKNGDDVEYVSITDLVPFNINTSTAQQIYDNKASVDKFVETPKDNYQKETPIVSGSGKFIWNGKNWVANK